MGALSITYNRKTTEVILPSRLSELTQQDWRSSALSESVITGDDTRLKMSIIQMRYPVLYKVMRADHIAEIIRTWSFEYDWKNTPVIEAHHLPFMRYVAPPPDFRTGTLREFIYMDEYLAENDILHLTALLYRREVRSRDYVAKDDYRIRLISRDQVAIMARTLQRHDCTGIRRMMAGALIYAYAIKHLVHELYGSRLFQGESTVSHNLGWTATALQVAEQGVFGSYENVLDVTLHEVMAYLLVKKSESDATKAAQEEAQKKS